MTSSDNAAAPSTFSLRELDLRWIVALITLFGLGLRLWGITWSLPNREHLYSYHPDEILIIQASYLADVWKGQFNPHFYNYGSLTIYLNSLLRPLAYALIAPGLYTDYLLGRTLTAFFGAGTIPLAYGLAHRIRGKGAGVVAAALIAIAPAHVLHSHYVTVDVPATFWVLLSLYTSVRVWQGEGVRWSLLAGAAAGLAAGTKYNAGIVILAVILAHFHRRSELWKVLGACLLAFLFSTPGVVLWTAQFWRDFSYEIAHTSTGHGWVFVGTPPAWIFHWTKNLRWGLGLPLLMLVTAALLSAVFHLWRETRTRATEGTEDGGEKRSRVHPYLILLAFAVPYYFVIGMAEVKFLRYTLPLIPVFLVLLSAELVRGFQSQHVRLVIVGVGSIIGFYTLLYTFSYTSLLSRVPPQDQAGAWLRQNAAGQTVGLTTAPWFYSPPVSPYNAGPQSRRAFEEHSGEAPYRLMVVGMDPDRLNAAAPDFLVLSDFETGDVERLSNQTRILNYEELKPSIRFLDLVRDRYHPEYTAYNRPSILLQPDSPPHDWLYPYPSVTVWRRKR